MRERFRRLLPIVLTALLTATLTVAGPSIAETVNKALFDENADKVDGIHAKDYTTNADQRANKLVATNGQGRLPNNIIKKAPDAAKLNGLKGARYIDHDARTLVVDKGGKGDFTTIQAAVNAAQPDPGTPYRILILRGTYNEQVTLEPNIHLEGAGLVRPLLTCECGTQSNTTTGTTATLTLAGGSTVKNIDVENTGGLDYSHGIDATGTNNVLLHVDVSSHGSSFENVGVYATTVGVSVAAGRSTPQGEPPGGTLLLDEVSVSGTSAASAARATGLRSQNIAITATDSSFHAAGAGADIAFANHAIKLESASHEFRRIEVDVSGPSPARSAGIHQEGSTSTVRDSNIRAVGSSHSYYGVFNSNANVRLQNVSIRAAGGTINQAVFNTGSGPVSRVNTIERSTLESSGAVVSSAVAGYTNNIATSQLNGAAVTAVAGSTTKCAGVYDEAFTFFAGPACP